MTEFTDSKNRTWNLDLTLGSAERVFDKTGVNLLAPNQTDENGVLYMTRLLYDDVLLGRVCAVLMDNQKPPVDEFDGKTLKELDDAFWMEYRRFFQDRGKVWAAAAAKENLKERADNAKKAEDQLLLATSSNSQGAQDASTIEN